MARKKGDKRKAWHQGRKNLKKQGETEISSSFLARINAIPSSNLKDLPSIITEAALEENVPIQNTVIEKSLERILFIMNPQSPKKPRPEQTRTLLGKGDTLLIARTGFGKSLIFHAYSILTGKITI
jgi:hypothetical protein